MKKIMTIALLSVCMSIFSICANAANIEETKEKLVAFGLIDTEFDVNHNPTRAEFSDIIARFFSKDTYNYSKEQIFRDVDAKHPLARSINKSAHYGIFSGVGGNRFMPEEEIDRGAMQVALVKLLGYSVEAEQNGGGWTDYTAVAGRLGLTSGIPADATLAETALLMVDNALDVCVTEPDLSGSGISVSKEKTLMNKALGIYEISGIVKGARMKALDVKYQSNSESVLVNTLRMETDNASIYADFVGSKVDAYYYTEDDVAYIVWCNERKNTVKTIKLSDIVRIENNEVIYEENDKNKTLKLNELPYIIYNNRPTTSIPAYSDNGTIKLIDAGEGYNTIDIKDYTTYVVENTNEASGIITTKLPSSAIELEEYEYTKVVDKDMNELKLSAIKEDDIISVMIDLDNTCIEIIRSADVISGAVEEVNLAECEITIDGIVYDITQSFAEKLGLYKLSSISAYVGEFSLDISGNIANFELQINEGSRVGYLIKLLTYENDVDTRPAVRILTDTGDIKEYRMRLKDGMIRVDGLATDAVAFKNSRTSNQVFTGGLITYSMNSKGEVREFELAAETGNEGLHLYKTINNARYRRDTYSFYNQAVLDEDVVIFHVPREEEYKDNIDAYALLTTWSFNNGGKYSGVKLYTFDEEPMSADVVIYEAKISGEGSNAYPALVTKIKTGLNADDEAVDILEGEMYSGSAGAESIVGGTLRTTESSVKGTITQTDVAIGDLVVYDTTFFGTTSELKLLYDCSEGTFYNTNPYMLNDYQMTYSIGTVTRREEDLLKLKLKDKSEYEYYRIPTTCKIFVVYDASGSKPCIEKGTIDDIRTSASHGNEHASTVFIHASNNTPQFMVIYNN